jgi:hypothetical protein
MITTSITVKSRNKKELQKVKAALKLVDANFEIVENQSPYNPEFVSKILEGSEAFKNGDYKTIKTEDLWK